MANFETQVFQDIPAADYKPTTQVDRNAGNLASTIGQAASQLIGNIYAGKQHTMATKTAKAEFEPVKQAFQLFERYQTDSALGVEKLLGEENRPKLEALLSDRLNIKNMDSPAIREAVGEFEKIARAKESGSTAEGVIHMRALSKMKELTNRYPGYGDALKQAATTSLGFDPTGSEIGDAISALNRMDAEKARLANQSAKLTPLQKSQQKVMDNMANTYGVAAPYEIASAVMQEHSKGKLQDEQLDRMIAEGKYDSGVAIQKYNIAVDEVTRQIAADNAKILAAGGRIDPEEVKARTRAQLQTISSQILTNPSFAMAGPQQMAAFNSYAENRVKYLEATVDSGAMEKILTGKNNTTIALYTSKVLQDPVYGSVLSLGGKEGFASFLATNTQLAGNVNLTDVMIRINPEFAGMDAVSRQEYLLKSSTAVATGGGSEQDKALAALGVKMQLQQGGTKDDQGKPVKDDLLSARLKNIGTGKSIDILIDPKVADQAATNPHVLKDVNELTSSYASQIKQTILREIPKDVRAGLKGEIVTDKDGLRRIKWTLDREAIKADKANKSFTQEEMSDMLDAYGADLNKTNTFFGTPNSIGKGLNKFYKLGQMYGDRQLIKGVKSADDMLQDIIDSTTETSSKE